MKTQYISGILCLFAIGCSSELSPSRIYPKHITLTAIADGECYPTSKTILADNGTVLWNSNDNINVFYKNQSESFSINGQNITFPAEIVNFEGELDINDPDNPEDYIYAIYPYDDSNTCINGEIKTTFPSRQVCTGLNPHDNSALISISRSHSLNMPFYNIYGGIAISVNNDNIRAIGIKGNNHEILAGDVTVSFNSEGKPYVKNISNPIYEIILSVGYSDFSGYQYFKNDGTLYHITCLPTPLDNGCTITFYTDNQKAELVIEKSLEIKRSVWGRISNGDAKVSFSDYNESTIAKNPSAIPNDEIWYNTTSSKPLTFYDSFKETISKHYFDGEKYIIKFYEDISILPIESIQPDYTTDITTIVFPSTIKGLYAYNEVDLATNIYLNSTNPPAIYLDEEGLWTSIGTSANIYVPASAYENYITQTGEWEYVNVYKQVRVAVTDNQILYKSTNGSKIDVTDVVYNGINKSAFDANIVSNTYSDGIGIITFDKPITALGEFAVHNVSTLSELYLPDNITSIYDRSIVENKNLRILQLPLNLKEISNLSGNESLEFIYLPVNIIEEGAFMGCESLKYIFSENTAGSLYHANYYINESTLIAQPADGQWMDPQINRVGTGAFSCFNGKKSTSATIAFRAGLISVGNSAFADSNISIIRFPSTLQELGYNCFSMSNVQEAYFKSEEPPVLNNGDNNTMQEFFSPGMKIYVPNNSVLKYKSAKYWNSYAQNIHGYVY